MVNHVSDCSKGGATINTASQLQVENLPESTFKYNYIGFMGTVGSPVNVSTTVGGHSQSVSPLLLLLNLPVARKAR
jgi:hypothetical protein